ncbi:MAG: alpha/beta hydrolase [Firmicutes bacterium]|nr:alpha/beta hydrolase [Bacillota bacterium]
MLVVYIIISLLGFYIFVSLFDFCMIILRWPSGTFSPRMAVGKKTWPRYRDEVMAGQNWLLAQNRERVEIKAHDGIKLVGEYLPACHSERTPICHSERSEESFAESKITVLLMHGYRASATFMFGVAARLYHEMGLNILLVHERAHGLSGGYRVTFGVKERLDCRRWAEYLAGRLGEDSEIILSGGSMGAATVLMASGLDLPKQVRGVIADSGFTTPREIFTAVLSKRRNLFARAYVSALWPMARFLGGFDMDAASTLDAMRAGKLPVLLIHGDADRMVPCEMSRQNYEAGISVGRGGSNAPRLLIVPGAGHCMSCLLDRERCQQEIVRFIQEYTSILPQNI